MLLALHYWMGDVLTAQGPRLRNDLYCVEWDVKLYYTIPSLHIGEQKANGEWLPVYQHEDFKFYDNSLILFIQVQL